MNISNKCLTSTTSIANTEILTISILGIAIEQPHKNAQRVDQKLGLLSRMTCFLTSKQTFIPPSEHNSYNMHCLQNALVICPAYTMEIYNILLDGGHGQQGQGTPLAVGFLQVYRLF